MLDPGLGQESSLRGDINVLCLGAMFSQVYSYITAAKIHTFKWRELIAQKYINKFNFLKICVSFTPDLVALEKPYLLFFQTSKFSASQPTESYAQS